VDEEQGAVNHRSAANSTVVHRTYLTFRTQIGDSVLALPRALGDGWVQHDCASGVFAWIDGVVDAEPYLLGLYSYTGGGAPASCPNATPARAFKDTWRSYGF
jgi:hypothetical protein